MFRIAAQRNSTVRLSEVCRYEALRVGRLLGNDTRYYLNTHLNELGHPELFQSLETLRDDFPDLPVVLEIHESAVTSTKDLLELRAATNALNISLAYDDFGSGQTRLIELTEVPPETLKFDIKIIQGLPTATVAHRSTIASLI